MPWNNRPKRVSELDSHFHGSLDFAHTIPDNPHRLTLSECHHCFHSLSYHGVPHLSAYGNLDFRFEPIIGLMSQYSTDNRSNVPIFVPQ